ncbi:MAG: cation diffusion facilitator family transporter [Pseudomonadales bacterium]|jgi:cobalt-zinc-cadmium efflux system protein|nr:cation diffusion facilitator family transporter [Pseudomonadales bacterium]MDP6471899.1 cation diffusion facilitator family transporter [Pseudomonadales bacterium]MDP6826831.1 cation diffusion facilitator family transporter [Pseudomonadales bacterium]MDP6970891.1 cation diffusion facilitator family transporter [Pseudomonadales bacterium]
MSHLHADDHNEAVLKRAFFVITGFALIEVAGGIVANSLTLLADAGHMFLDATALGLAWYAMRLSRREIDGTLSYGYHRWQVLAAFVNGLTLLLLVVWILIEAITRIHTPETMLPLPALSVAATGFVINLIVFRWLHGRHSANVRAAALHVLGDLLGSAAAIIAAVVVYFWGWTQVDALLALVIAVILGRGAWRVLRESTHILLEGVPTGLDLDEITHTLSTEVPGVTGVHHVHAWALTAEKPLLTLHANIDERLDTHAVVAELKRVLLGRFGIDHSTIQVESGPCPDHQ